LQHHRKPFAERRIQDFWTEKVSMGEFNPEMEEDVRSETGKEVKEPPFYKVLLLNDDYTTMDFVVEVLRFVFHKSMADATFIMLNVHHNGVGVCGIYSFEVAETKVNTVESLARERGFPLKCTMERE
jgi:ATP-dependent Clp protease adaptor protein ClpS